MDRIDLINELQEKSYKTTKKSSIIINNFFSLITIVIISITIIVYVNYIVPAQKRQKQITIEHQQQAEFRLKREKEIALSHELNNIK